MRLIIILLALYTLTASAHNKIPAVFQPPPDTCVCRDENCWDTSCEESHCLCLVVGVQFHCFSEYTVQINKAIHENGQWQYKRQNIAKKCDQFCCRPFRCSDKL